MRSALMELWNTVFPDDPPHNEPSIVIEAKLAVDDLIFLAVHVWLAAMVMAGGCMQLLC
jgi:hypothetical protein